MGSVRLQVTLTTPALAILVAAAIGVLAVTRVLSLRWSRSIGQLVATAALVPVAAVFVLFVHPAEQYIVSTPSGVVAAVVPSLLLMAWGHVAMAISLAIAGILTVAFPARRRLAPLPPPPKRAGAPASKQD